MSFPNQLADPKPLRLPLTGAGARLALLLALCLAPRIWMADRIGSVCPDGALYIEKAQHLEQDGPPATPDSYDFNFYLLVLRAWHRAGLDWEMAGTVWGILASSLAVLPLFGWVRRMFDDRVALLAGALYAAHPKLIEWSPEALRDPTFWLLFTTALYCSWRAVTEVRPGWFFAAGVVTFLAVNTRFEGWFLLLPTMVWCGWRWLALRQGRWQLAGGAGLFGIAYPLVTALLVYGHGYPQWGTRASPLDRLTELTRTRSDAPEPTPPSAAPMTAPPTDAPAAAESDGSDTDTASSALAAHAEAAPTAATDKLVTSDAPASARPTPRQTAWLVLDKVCRAFTVVFGVPVLLGLARWWRLCLRTDRQPLVLLAGITVAAVWVHAAEIHMSSTRYLLPLVIVCTPLAALGLLPLCRWAGHAAGWLAPRRGLAPHFAATAVLLGVLAGGAADAITSRVSSRTAKADLGGWLGERIGAEQTIAGSYNWRLTTYYAGARFHPLPLFSCDLTPEKFGKMLTETRPEALLLCRRRMPMTVVRSLSEQASARGFELVDPRQLPDSCRGRVLVLLRRPAHVADRRAEQ